MTCRMAVRGIGLVGGFGCGKQAALNALRNGGKPNNSLLLKTSEGPISPAVYLADPKPLNELVALNKLRRVNKYSRLAVLAAGMALQDANQHIHQDHDMGVIVASGYGAITTTSDFLGDIISYGDSFASPTSFSNSVHSSAASHITILLQIKGPCLTVTQFEMSIIAALLNAQMLLQDKKVDAVLLGGVEEINPMLLYCYYSFWGKDMPKEIEPLNFELQTAIPGEGAAFMVLTRDEDESTPPYSYIDSVLWNSSNGHTLPKDIMIITGSDGHRACGMQYKKLLRRVDPTCIKMFSQIYGSMPCGQIFDLILGFIAARDGLVPNSFNSIKLDVEGNLGVVCCSG